MDSMQTNMVSILMQVPRTEGEDWVGFVRRKRRVARDVCARLGFWSLDWAKKQISWHDHVMRHAGPLKDLLLLRNHDWLLQQRSRFVPSFGSEFSRVSLAAGRTGTRLNIGKPASRWDASIELAKASLAGRADSQNSNHALSIGTRIRQASLIISQFFTGRPPD